MRLRLLLAGLSCLLFSAPTLADQPIVKLETSLGTILIQLNAEKAPDTVANFLQYVDDGFYDGTVFHRVIDGFMIQGGGFTEQFEKKPVRASIRNEAANGLKNYRYSIAMARTNQPHSANSQFFINSEDNRRLDHTAPTPSGWGYTVFGKVVEGSSVVDDIGTVETGSKGPFPRDAPTSNIVILHASRVTH
jgi:cyclophilin family peptidyl-prolyl cis-trans isomerase